MTFKKSNFCNVWVTSEEKVNHSNYEVIELKEIENSRKQIESPLKKSLIHYYIEPEVFQNPDSVLEYKFKDLEFYLSHKLPKVDEIRKGDFGEIFGTEFLKQKHNYCFPLNKFNDKYNKDLAPHGEDILGFKHENEDIICLCICESKTHKQFKTKVLNNACKQLKESNIEPKSLIRIYEELLKINGGLANNILKVMREEMDTIEKHNWIFYILENRSIKIFNEHECLNSLENFKLVYFHLKDLTNFVNHLYDDYGDILDE